MIFKVDATGEIAIKNGKLVRTQDKGHLVERVLLSNKADFLFEPLLAPNIIKYRKASLTPAEEAAMLKEMRINIEYCGFQVNEVKIVNGELLIDIEDDN
jgi:hypothetical protein